MIKVVILSTANDISEIPCINWTFIITGIKLLVATKTHLYHGNSFVKEICFNKSSS